MYIVQNEFIVQYYERYDRIIYIFQRGFRRAQQPTSTTCHHHQYYMWISNSFLCVCFFLSYMRAYIRNIMPKLMLEEDDKKRKKKTKEE